jgi:hypothetical protein
MTLPASEVDVAVVGQGRSSDQGSYIDWAAIIAGAVLAAAISFIFFTFGSAIGLSLASPLDAENPSPLFFVIAASIWFIWVAVSSFMAGGYLAGRMRRRLFEGTPHESDVRDGSHGLMVWALGALVGALLAASGVVSATRTGVEAAATVSSGAAAGIVGAIDESADPLGYTLDSLLRQPAPDAATTDGSTATVRMPTAQQSRVELGNILVRATDEDGLTDDDRAYAARLIAARTGLSEAEAAQRIDAAVAEIQAAEQAALEAAEAARKMGILIAFLTAATMLISAVGAWWAAGVGGRHRDEGTEFVMLSRWR